MSSAEDRYFTSQMWRIRNVLGRPFAPSEGEKIEEILRETARDQRHACAEAAVSVKSKGDGLLAMDTVHAAVMNAAPSL